MQNVTWNPDLTSTIQSDLFYSIVEDIRRASDELAKFATNPVKLEPLPPGGDTGLALRAHIRRSRIQRSSEAHQHVPAIYIKYAARDTVQETVACQNVYEILQTLQAWPSKLRTTQALGIKLQSWSNFGGHGNQFDKALLSDYLELDMSDSWGSVVDSCLQTEPSNRHSTMFRLGMAAFRKDADMDAIRLLAAYTILHPMKAVVPPQWTAYTDYCKNEVPREESLVLMMKTCLIPYAGDDRDSFGLMLSGKLRRKYEAAEAAHERQQEKDCKALAKFMVRQWPCADPSLAGFEDSVLVDIEQAMQIIRPRWLQLFQNHELSGYVDKIQAILDDHQSDEGADLLTFPSKEVTVYAQRVADIVIPSLQLNLLPKACTLKHLAVQTSSVDRTSQHATLITKKPFPVFRPQLAHEMHQLDTMFRNLAGATSHVKQRYGSDLLDTLTALRKVKNNQERDLGEISDASLFSAIQAARNKLDSTFQLLRQSFEQDDDSALWLQQGNLWPATTPVVLLENLRSTSQCRFGDTMKKHLLQYAINITELQRLLRIQDFRQKRSMQRTQEEQKNVGHTNWNPSEHPDWLLLEIDANMLLREVQVVVARATISPESKENSVLQMNMGEGKTSCIMPMAAATLANGNNLVRVVVPKALLLQTAQTLIIRLGGLVGR